jgi:nucleotide-binding universal stress UspA family protein
MYTNILIPLENSSFDDAILNHLKPLIGMTSAKVILVHVADGFMARNQHYLGESDEMRQDKAYLDRRESELSDQGINVRTILATGEPAKQILEIAEKEGCDLIAMSTHGHRGLADLILGSVAEDVRHRTRIPVLLMKG